MQCNDGNLLMVVVMVMVVVMLVLVVVESGLILEDGFE